jgi:hypothetical protein
MSKSQLFYDRRSVGQSVLVLSPHLGPKTRFLLLSDSCGFVDIGAPSLARGRVCHLQLLLVHASAIIFGSVSRGTHDHILLSRFETPPTWRAESSYLYPPGRGWPSYTPKHLVPFSSPPTIRSATVEVFETASTQETD